MIRFFLILTILLYAPSSNADERVLDIKKVTSPNGITAWLVEDHKLPLIAFQFSFEGAGSINVSEEKQGLSLLLSNTMDEGAGDLDSQSFQKQLSDYSISLSFSSSRDNFGGRVKTLTRHREKAFDLLKLALEDPRFNEEPLERMKQSNLARIRNVQSDPEWITARLFNDIIYKDHPYALNSGGTLSSLLALTADDLKHYKEKYLTKDRLVVGVMGDITAEELTPLLDHIFGNLPTSADKKEAKIVPIQNTGKTFLHKKDIPQSIIMMALPSIDENHPDYYALQVLNHIFGASGFGSRLMEEAREKRGLTYGIYSGLNNYDEAKALTISTSTQNKTAQEIISVIHNEMTKLHNDDLEEEIKKAKSYIIGSLPLSLTSTDNIASILTSLQLNDRPINYLDQYAEKINAVTKNDIQLLAKELLLPKELTTIIVGSPEKIENYEEIVEIPNVE